MRTCEPTFCPTSPVTKPLISEPSEMVKVVGAPFDQDESNSLPVS
jgi:hypothetical protein